jgi:hypothetical protein
LARSMSTIRRWPNLTRALDDPTSPARRRVDALITDRAALRQMQREHTRAAGTQRVASLVANPGTIGTAFDIALRFLYAPAPNLALALPGAVLLGNATTNATIDLITRLGGRVAPRAAIEPITPSWPAEPLRDLELLTRGCWALALLTEVYRAGPIPGTVIDRYAHASGAPTADGLLTLAPAEAVTELSRLLDLSFQQLLPDLRARPAPWYVGPTFTLSTALRADADLIAYHTLVEIKTGLGRKTNDGRRAASLALVTLRQLLGYVLHDADDTYSLREVAVYDARFGYLDSWQLQGMPDLLAGRTVDLPAERAAWRLALTG